MSDNSEQSIAELATPEPEVLDQEVTEVEIESDPDAEAVEAQPAEDEDEEIEHNGEKYKIPKALKDAFLMQQDYTKKTMEVADIRKAVETQQQELKQRVEFQQAHLQDIVELASLEKQLGQYNAVDWNQLIDTDPVEAMKLDKHRQSLMETYQVTLGKIQQAQQIQALTEQQETAKRIEQSREALASELRDWSPEVASEVRGYLKSYERLGINEEIIEAINRGLYGTAPIVWARKAQLYDQLTQKAARKESVPPPRPVTKIGSKATVTKDPSQMSDKEFAAWRQKQIKQRS